MHISVFYTSLPVAFYTVLDIFNVFFTGSLYSTYILLNLLHFIPRFGKPKFIFILFLFTSFVVLINKLPCFVHIYYTYFTVRTYYTYI